MYIFLATAKTPLIFQCHHTPHLQPRESMFGGRTQPFQAYAEATATHEIVSYDYCSLYPYTNMKGACYPIGQPRVLRIDFPPIVAGEPVPFRGLVFCDMLPPPDAAIPVLPGRFRSKLVFSLCRTCAQQGRQEKCPHKDEKQRFLTGCWYSEELNLAIKMGYKLLRYHEVWAWGDAAWFRGGFFQSFLGPLLKLKHEASGWPRPNMTEQERQQHIDTIAANDGVVIDASRVAKNPALRQMCKLFLNSAWGKFAQNPRKVETKLIDIADGDAVFAFFNSPAHEPTCLELWGDKHILVGRQPLQDGIRTTRFTNVVYGSITTAVARMCLYEAMSRVGAENLVYCGKRDIRVFGNFLIFSHSRYRFCNLSAKDWRGSARRLAGGRPRQDDK